jgi:hypothetical protein
MQKSWRSGKLQLLEYIQIQVWHLLGIVYGKLWMMCKFEVDVNEFYSTLATQFRLRTKIDISCVPYAHELETTTSPPTQALYKFEVSGRWKFLVTAVAYMFSVDRGGWIQE